MLSNETAVLVRSLRGFMGRNKSKLRRERKAKVLELPPLAPKKTLWEQLLRAIIFLLPVVLACYFVWDLNNEN